MIRQTHHSVCVLIRRYRAVLRHSFWMNAVQANPAWLRGLRKQAGAVTMGALLVAASEVCATPPSVTQVTPDLSKTQTTVTTSGTTFDVRTSTITGTNALNAFTRFDVAQGNTVNLHLPSGTVNLINVVNGQSASEIHGVVNSLKADGKLGGHVYFLNPKGIVIGADGVFNVGSLTLQVPTDDFVEDFFSKPGSHVETVLSGKVPIGDAALISIEGKINAMDSVVLGANKVLLTSASIRAGEVARAEFARIANVEGLVPGTAFEVKEGSIRIVASSDGDGSAQITMTGSSLSADKKISLISVATSPDSFAGKEQATISIKEPRF